jgi:hypothetical protein
MMVQRGLQVPDKLYRITQSTQSRQVYYPISSSLGMRMRYPRRYKHRTLHFFVFLIPHLLPLPLPSFLPSLLTLSSTAL